MLILSDRFIGFLPCNFAASHVAAGRLRSIQPRPSSPTSTRIACRKRDEDRAPISGFLDVLLRIGKSASAAPGRSIAPRGERASALGA